MALTVGDIIGRVITELSQVPGISTQLYSAGRIQQYVENAISLEENEMWWPPLMWYQQVPLDGVNGLLTQDIVGPISAVDDYTNIAAVYRDGSNRKLPELPQSLNPFTITTGGTPAFISADGSAPNRPFKVWPNDSAGSVVVWARQSTPLPVSTTDKVYLDPLLLTYDAAWMYVVDDGTVPQQVQKLQMLAQKRRQQMKAGFAQHPLRLDPRFPSDMVLQDEMATGWFTLDQDPLA